MPSARLIAAVGIFTFVGVTPRRNAAYRRAITPSLRGRLRALKALAVARLRRWDEMGLYEQILARNAGRPRFVLHDGPPYTSGPIHLGTAMNKCLKDFIVKSKTMSGYDSPYTPGWDCHGLPIEIKVDGQLGSKKAGMTAAHHCG